MPARVSLCMIVRDEEENLRRCLENVRGVFDETIVVDTGSRDRTREVAGEFGGRVVEFPWCDDFAAARNAGVEAATGDWVFWLDADDRIWLEDLTGLEILIQSLTPDEPTAYLMRTSSGAESAVHWHVRLFRRLPQVRWRYRVHEQIVNALQEVGHALRRTEIVICHEGYADPQLLKLKLERNLRLLARALEEHPGDPFLVMSLGSTYLALERPTDAAAAFEWYLRVAPSAADAPAQFYYEYAMTERQRGDLRRAIELCRTGLAGHPEHPELLLLDSVLQHQAGRPDAAANSLENLLKRGRKPLLGEIDIRRYRKACGNLIALLRNLGRTTDADEWLVRVAREDPAYLPAGIAAGGMLLRAGRLDELEELLAPLEAAHPSSADVALLRGQALVARGQIDQARAHLGAAMSRVTQPERIREALGRLPPIGPGTRTA
jgi:tetratricopeptide (TPR) repeat protein